MERVTYSECCPLFWITRLCMSVVRPVFKQWLLRWNRRTRAAEYEAGPPISPYGKLFGREHQLPDWACVSGLAQVCVLMKNAMCCTVVFLWLEGFWSWVKKWQCFRSFPCSFQFQSIWDIPHLLICECSFIGQKITKLFIKQSGGSSLTRDQRCTGRYAQVGLPLVFESQEKRKRPSWKCCFFNNLWNKLSVSPRGFIWMLRQVRRESADTKKPLHDPSEGLLGSIFPASKKLRPVCRQSMF